MKFFQFSVMFLLFSQLFSCKQYFAKQKQIMNKTISQKRIPKLMKLT